MFVCKFVSVASGPKHLASAFEMSGSASEIWDVLKFYRSKKWFSGTCNISITCLRNDTSNWEKPWKKYEKMKHATLSCSSQWPNQGTERSSQPGKPQYPTKSWGRLASTGRGLSKTIQAEKTCDPVFCIFLSRNNLNQTEKRTVFCFLRNVKTKSNKHERISARPAWPCLWHAFTDAHCLAG